MPDLPNQTEQSPESDPLAELLKSQHGAWIVQSAALVLTYRLRQPVLAKVQIANYISSVVMPVQGNRPVGARMRWRDARKIVRKIARDLDRAMAELQREQEQDEPEPK
jgi:hypothetical protein